MTSFYVQCGDLLSSVLKWTGTLLMSNHCTVCLPHLTTSMEAAPHLKKSVVSSMAETLLRIPFQMFCGLKYTFYKVSKPALVTKTERRLQSKSNSRLEILMVYLPWAPLPSSSHHQSAPHWHCLQKRSTWMHGSSSHLQTAGSLQGAEVQTQSWYSAATRQEETVTNCNNTHSFPISSM